MQGLVGAVFEGIGVSLGSFVAGVLFNSIGGSATFRLFATGSLIFLVLHVVIQKIYARFAGTNGKKTAATTESDNRDLSNKVVYVGGDGGTDGNKNIAQSGGATRVLLAGASEEDSVGFREVSLK